MAMDLFSAVTPGPRNSLCDVDGVKVGAAEDATARTGVSVVLPDAPATAAVDVRGGGPGARETDVLAPSTLVEKVDAIVLSGGSVYGLEAASGVAAWLGAQGRGFQLVPRPGTPPSPIVPAAVLYDLANGGDKDWGETPPYRALGREACAAAGADIRLGNAGAGYGAMAGAVKGGLGSASAVTDDGWQIGALAAVNAFGSAIMPGCAAFWTWPWEVAGEFGGARPPADWAGAAGLPPDTKLGAPVAGANTTLGVIAVNAALSPAEAQRLAIMAQDGLARALRPVHGPTDGDIVFALATGAKSLPEPTAMPLTRLGALAADTLARAVARGVYEAQAINHVPAYRDLHGHGA